MSEFTVYFTTVASSPGIVVEAEDYDDALDKAWGSDKLPGVGSICHQCACKFDMGGDWEPNVVVDHDGKEVWAEKR